MGCVGGISEMFDSEGCMDRLCQMWNAVLCMGWLWQMWDAEMCHDRLRKEKTLKIRNLKFLNMK